MILVDTSAWVEFDRATGSPVHRRLRELIRTTDLVCTTQPVVTEVVIGARTDQREQELRRMLTAFPLLPFDADVDFDAGATIYRRCRRRGVTPRGLLDCLIAAVAVRHGASILAADVDLAHVGDVMGIELDLS